MDEKIDDHKGYYWASKKENNPYLLLDLGQPSLIKNVAVTSVKSKGSNTLMLLSAYIGNVPAKKVAKGLPTAGNPLCGVIKKGHKGGDSVTIACTKPMTGRYIILVKGGLKQIFISEVEINDGLSMNTNNIA